MVSESFWAKNFNLMRTSAAVASPDTDIVAWLMPDWILTLKR